MASQQQLSELDAWLTIYATQAADLDTRTAAAVVASYATVDDWLNPSQTVPAALAAMGAAQAARQAQAGFMTEFLQFAIDLLGGGSRIAVPRDLGLTYPRQADPFDVYSRPVFDARTALQADFDEEFARIAAEQRAELLATTDALLARRAAATVVLDNTPGVTGYRRVIRPEMSKTGVCGLCVAAAMQKYSTKDLLPIHTLCKCTVLPILGDEDPAVDFNEADLDAAYADAPGTTGADLKRTRFKVEDTELGPTLTPHSPEDAKQRALGSAGHTTTPASAPKSAGSAGGFTREQVELQLGILADLKDSPWRTAQLARFRALLAQF